MTCLLLGCFDNFSFSITGYESILNTTPIKKKYIRLIYNRSKLLIE